MASSSFGLSRSHDQLKSVFPLPQIMCPPNLAERRHTMNSFRSESHMIFHQSHGLLGFTWQVKYIASLLAPGQWPPNMARWWLTQGGGLLSKRHITLYSHCHMRSCDELKLLNLHYLNTYGHQTQQGNNVFWRACTSKVLWPFNHLVLQDHVTNWKHFFTTTMYIATRLCQSSQSILHG